MSDSILLIKKSKILTEISKAVFGPDVKSVFACSRWYHQNYSKADVEADIREKLKRFEEDHKGFVRHKDNTGVTLNLGSDTVILEYKDGRLLQFMGSEWCNVKLIARSELEEIL